MLEFKTAFYQLHQYESSSPAIEMLYSKVEYLMNK